MPAEFRPELSLEELVRRTKPAVVCLKSLNSSGSGFFVTETGIIATNAHVARGDSELLAVLPSGAQLPAKVVFIDPDLDLALVKAASPSADFVFPYLSLAGPSSVQQGESVLVIGNPGDAMLFSVTKGIVSAVGEFPPAGPGTWIQTDAPINPGNSGGPLVNTRGEVIGLNTLKLVKKNVTGIGFALSAGDLLKVLSRFYPALAPSPKQADNKLRMRGDERPSGIEQVGNPPASVPPNSSAPAVPSTPPAPSSAGFGTLTITCDIDAAKIFADGVFVGTSPAALRLSVGPHKVLVTSRGFLDYAEVVGVLDSSTLNLHALLKPLGTR